MNARIFERSERDASMGFFQKTPERPPEGTSIYEEIKRNKRFAWRDVIICLLIVGFFLLTKNSLGLGLGNYGGLAPVLEETRFGITDLDGTTHFFNYDDSDIEMRSGLKDFDKGEQLDGKTNRQVCSGTYRNSEFGEYQLHAQMKLDKYIVVRNSDGILVFNIESDETTQTLYDYFIERK